MRQWPFIWRGFFFFFPVSSLTVFILNPLVILEFLKIFVLKTVLLEIFIFTTTVKILMGLTRVWLSFLNCILSGLFHRWNLLNYCNIVIGLVIGKMLSNFWVLRYTGFIISCFFFFFFNTHILWRDLLSISWDLDNNVIFLSYSLGLWYFLGIYVFFVEKEGNKKKFK